MSPKKKVILFLFLTFALSLISYVPIIRGGTLDVQGGLFVFTLMYSLGQVFLDSNISGPANSPTRIAGLEITYGARSEIYKYCFHTLLLCLETNSPASKPGSGAYSFLSDYPDSLVVPFISRLLYRMHQRRLESILLGQLFRRSWSQKYTLLTKNRMRNSH